MKVERDGDRIVIVDPADRDRILRALGGSNEEEWLKAQADLWDAVEAAGLRRSGERIIRHSDGSLFFWTKGGEV